jgi:23S rRNA U2552 (ribose-2'-O)-methylase RlmE/FtsJ
MGRDQMTSELAPLGFQDLFYQHTGYLSDKWEQFLDIYDRELSAMVQRGAPLTLLEIGVQNGGSLAIWNKFLPDESRVIGIDIDPRCQLLEMPPSTTILRADISNTALVDELLGDARFDIIIDDGSHQQHDMLAAFRTLFDRLAPGGKYFIEDLHACYWPSHGGGYRTKGSMIEYLKGMVDAVHVDYVFDSPPGGALSEDESKELEELRALNAHIRSIKFYDSVAVIEKYTIPKQGRFKRVIAGEEMRVTEPLVLARVVLQNPDGFIFYGNSWRFISAAAIAASDEAAGARVAELAALQAELSRCKTELEALGHDQAIERAHIQALTAENLALQATFHPNTPADISDQPPAPEPPGPPA